MAASKHCATVVAILPIFIISAVFAEKVILDLHADQAKKWLDITCLYNDDYNDFWVFGFPVELSGNDDQYPTKRGFWTAGHAQRCEMHYYGGDDMPYAKTLRIGVYSKGKPEMVVTSKHSILEDEYTETVGGITEKDGQGWIVKTIDLSNKHGLVFNFTLSSGMDDVFLIDTIEFDLGDDTTTPTEPPPPTTVRPITDEGTITLDTDKDYWLLWDNYCNYIEDFSYLWAFGCEDGQPLEDDLGTGYWHWNKCIPRIGQSCVLRYSGNDANVTRYPNEVKIRGYVDKGLINVTLCAEVEGCSLLGQINDTAKNWAEQSFPVELEQNQNNTNYQIVVRITTTAESTVFVDKLELVGITEGSDGGGQETTTKKDNNEGDSSSGVIKFNWLITLFIVGFSKLLASSYI